VFFLVHFLVQCREQMSVYEIEIVAAGSIAAPEQRAPAVIVDRILSTDKQHNRYAVRRQCTHGQYAALEGPP
jgi:hypothetical protein